jgi:glutathione S-transferase
VLIDSAAILDWLDQTVGPERALLPPAGAGRTGTPSVAHAARDRTSGRLTDDPSRSTVEPRNGERRTGASDV